VRSSRRIMAAGCSLAIALTLGACGISTTGGPKAIPKGQLPNVPADVSTTTTPPNSDFLSATIVLLEALSNLPVAVSRAVPAQSDQLATVLADLLLGPQGKEQSQGFYSAIPTTTRLRSVSPGNLLPNSTPSGPITVDLSLQFVESSDPELEVQQVVATVSCFFSPTVPVRVLFKVDGEPQAVQVASGIAVTRPVTINDYGTAPNCTPSS
jgi:hypothetical protein